MFTCKQVSRALENENYEDMTPLRKAFLRFHIAICIVCGKYNTQVMEMHKLSRCFCEQEVVGGDVALSDEKREQIKQALADAEHDAA